MKIIVSIAIISASLFLATTSIEGDTVLSNFQQNIAFAASVGNGVSEGYGAIQFFSGSSAPVWNLDSVTLELAGPADWGTRANGPILYSAYIYNGASNVPTSQLAFLGSFNFTNQTDLFSQVTFNPSIPISISSNSEYWIIVGAVTACPAGGLEGTAGHYNDVSGSDWQFGILGYYSPQSPPQDQFFPLPSYYGPYLQIQATVQSVPEPPTFTSVGLCAALGVLCYWYKRFQCAKSVLLARR